MADPIVAEGFLITNQGFALLAKALAGKELRFLRVEIGDSVKNNQMQTVTDAQALTMTALIHSCKTILIASCTHSNSVANIEFVVANNDVTSGFFIRETGIFARDPDTGASVLYAYQNVGAKGCWLPPAGGSEIWEQRIVVALATAQAQNVTAVIDSGLLYVTQEEFRDHINSNTPHPNTPSIANAVTETDYIWTSGSDNNLHPMTIDNFRQQALGGDTAQIPLMNSRLSQVEVNVANLAMQLKIEDVMGFKPNLLIADDFEDNDFCDFYRQPVITSVAGVSSVRVASNVGINAGSWYTLSDGAQNEFVQVKSVAKNGEAEVAVLSDNVTNTYDLPNTFLYRTTLTIDNGTGTGAGDTRNTTYPFTETWQGTSANDTVTNELNTTYANQAAFTLSGDWAFSDNGEFTLA